GAKIFLSAKRLIDDPWKKVKERYELNSKVKGTVLKVNPFGLFVQLDDDIHALAHISSLGLKPGEKITEKFSADKAYDFYIISIEPEAHRLGLSANPLSTPETKKPTEEKATKRKKTEVVEEEVSA
ncbi:MAG: S1 RNA-binding domain-containing protein, partial [Patescibacteria group bacterium]